MRWLTLSAFTMTFALAGCGCHDGQPTSTTPTSSTSECCEGDCCTDVSRAALLAKGSNTSVPTIELSTIKYEAFMKDVKAQSGKVVCLYQWAENFKPTTEHLSDLLALQNKFGKDLVCITVSMNDGKARNGTLDTLRKLNCTTINYLHDESDTAESWAECFGCCGVPSVVVLARDGKQVDTFTLTDAIDFAAVEKTIAKCVSVK